MGVMDRYNEKRKKKQDTSSNENSSGGVRERYEINKYFSSFPVDSVDQKYIDTFISDATNFFSSAEKSYSSLGYSNSSETYDTISNSWKDLDTRRNTIRAWLYKNRSNIDEETYNNVSKSLDSFNNDAQSIISSFEKALNEYSQFETEDAYNEYYNRYAKYGELSNTSEAATGWEKYLADVETSKQTAEAEKENEKWYEKIGRYLYGSGGTGTADTSLPTSNVSVAVGALREDDSHARPQENWTEEQKKVFGALYSSNPSEAYEYAIYTNSLNAKTAEVEQIKKIQESATSSFGAGFGNTIGAIVTAPLGLADYLNDLAYANAGRDIAPDGIVSPFEYSQSVTGGISSHLNTEYGTLDEDIPIFGGKGVGDIYGLGTSIAQSALSAYTLGGTGTLVSYFGQGAASGMDEALSRGATETQAILYGTAVGVFEGLAEQIGIDNLFKLGSSSTVKGFIKNILKQAGAEGAEEGLTSLLSNIADNVIMQSKSNFNALVEQYMKQGMSESEAKKKAWMDSVGGIAFDTIAGAVSGAVHATPYTAIQNVKANKSASKMYGDSTSDLVTEALDIDSNNKYAQKMQNRLNKGKNLSGSQINRLVEANESAMYNQDVSAIQNAAKERLTTLGETGNIEAISKALAKQAQGKKLTPSESQAIKNSKYGQRVANELNTENIKSGQYSSAWAEQIGTNRINAEEYSRALADAETATKTTQTVENFSPAPQTPPQQVEKASVTENIPTEENATEDEFEVSEGVSKNEEMKSTVTLEEASKKYGAQAQAMIHTYTEGQDIAEYENAYGIAYNMGMSGVSLSYAMNSKGTSYLTEKQRELAYEAGKAAADTTAKEQDAKNKSLANDKTGRKKGTVKGEGVTISDLKKTFNDTQNKAYKILSTYAEATGIDIVLYKSESNADGDFEGSQGKFKWSEDKIYIDINAGLTNIKDVNDLAKYAMVRTFSHEFTHFIEKWNPIWYNEFRKVVFDTLTERGENVDDLIIKKQNLASLSYDKASREVVAEAMTDILPDANFVETLATKHKNIFEKLLAKLKEFLADLKEYFNTVRDNSAKEANALKEQVEGAVHYVDNIVKLFDKVALEAVENYQATVATEESAVSKTEQVETKVVSETENTTVDIAKNATPTKEVTPEVDETVVPNSEGDAFSITDNAEFGTLEIKFDGKPSEAIRNVLKEHGFRWHRTKGVWYGKSERADIVKALQETYKNEFATNNIKEENKNAEFQTDKATNVEGRTDEDATGNNAQISTENGNGREISEGDREVLRESDRLRSGQQGELSQEKQRFPDDAFIVPKEGTVEAEEYAKLAEYGIEGYVVKKSEWDREVPAFALNGIIYMREGIDEKYRGMIVPHEATHIMKHLAYQPYLDFIDSVPDMLVMTSENAQRLINRPAEHYKIDVFDMSDDQRIQIFDEINAMIYGNYAVGRIIGDTREKIDSAFYDDDVP